MARHSRQRTPQDKVDYIVRHINDRPRMRIAREAGVSMATLYRVIREYGGELRYDLSTRDNSIENIVREHYPTMSGREIADKFGYTKERVNKVAKELGIVHNENVMLRLRKQQRANLRQSHTPECLAKRVRRFRITRRMDEMRVLAGEKPRTKLRFKKHSVAVYKAKWNLAKKYGYYISDSAYVMLYDGETRRLPHEDYYEKKYGLAFMEG